MRTRARPRAARALARSAGSDEPAFQHALGLAPGPLGSLQVYLRGQVGRLGQDHHAIWADLQEAAEDGELLLLAAALAARRTPWPRSEISGAWWGRMPSSPSLPGTMTSSTSPSKARRSGVTISRWSGIYLSLSVLQVAARASRQSLRAGVRRRAATRWRRCRRSHAKATPDAALRSESDEPVATRRRRQSWRITSPASPRWPGRRRGYRPGRMPARAGRRPCLRGSP